MKRFLISLLVSVGILSSFAPALAVGVGGACATETECNAGDCATASIGCYCSGSPGTCTVKGAAGAVCTASAPCRSGLTCSSGTCATAPAGSAPDANAAPTIHTPSEYGYVNPLGTTNIRTIINRVIRAALGFVGALFLAMFVYGGAVWMTAAGDEKKVQSAKTTLRNAVIGILVVALSYGLISIIFEFAGQVRAPANVTPGAST